MHCSKCGEKYEGVRFRCPVCRKFTSVLWLNLYSAVLLVVLVSAGNIFLVKLLPSLAAICAGIGEDLPVAVRLYAEVLQSYGLLLALGGLALFLFVWLRRVRLLSFVVSGFGAAFVTLMISVFTLIAILAAMTEVMILFPDLWTVSATQNRLSAVLNIMEINRAEKAYRAKYPEVGFTCNLKDLAPPVPDKAPDRTAADLLPAQRAQESRQGYKFEISGCSPAPSSTYLLEVSPVESGVSGRMAFCSDESGAIQYVRDAKTDSCVEKLKSMGRAAPALPQQHR